MPNETEKPSQELKTLIRQRSNLNSRLTKLINYVDSFADDVDNKLISLKQDRLLIISQEFQEIQNKIELITDCTDKELDYREDFENKVDELSARLKGLLDEKLITVDNIRESISPKPSLEVNNQALKLPTIKIPSFQGDVKEWYHFRDVFESLIVKNQGLTNVQKFHYLLSALHGEAHGLIKNIPITDANFENAYILVCNRYNNKRLIATNHVKALLNLPSSSKNNSAQLRKLINEVSTNCDAVKALELDVSLDELLLVQLVLSKVDMSTRTEFESSFATEQIATLKELIDFLEHKCQTEQLICSEPHQITASLPRQSHSKLSYNKSTKANSMMATNFSSCLICKGTHKLHKCHKYISLNTSDKLSRVKQFRLCLNCLKPGHQIKECPSDTSCFKCNKRHHTSLHFDHQTNQPSTSFSKQTPIEGAQIVENESRYQTEQPIRSCYASHSNRTQVLLATALVNVRDDYGNYIICRAVLDNGSQVNFITEKLVQQLKLKRFRNSVPIESFNNMSYESKYNVNIEIASLNSHFTMKLNCNVLPKITTDLPASHIEYESWNLPSDIILADPDFHIPQRIDLLLGAQVFMKILLMEQQTRPGVYPVVQNTKLGWIVSGEFQDNLQKINTFSHQSLFVRQENSIDNQLQKFWEIEEVNKPAWSTEEKECEEHFIANTSRDEQGHYIVKLPLRQDLSTLGESRSVALQRLQRLERRLSSDEQLSYDYHEFLTNYLKLGHMQLASPTCQPSYFLPHHAVFKQDSTTTKIRVVFDASCKTSNNLSLNDILKVGPVVQQDLYTIVLRFRTRQIAFIADVNKMYRQINIHPNDYNCQRILWRSSETEPVQEYQLTTVTYGTSAAPYLATRCLQKLAEDEQDSYSQGAINILKNDFYVDDCISGADQLGTAIKLVSELQSLLGSGGFELRKWASNCPQLLETIPYEHQERQLSLQIHGTETVKALGLRWQPSPDQFQIVSGINSSDTQLLPVYFTKRKVLATISSIFDPLGLLAPIVILCKIFMQRIWKEHLDWDNNIPIALQHDWSIIYRSLSVLDEIHIDRLVVIKYYISAQLHGFSDASETAYGACVYLRSCDPSGQVMVKLICAKSRVAPLKQISLPRLELCAAVLLARLIVKVKNSLDLEFDDIHLWTDSNIVLAWLNKCPSTWKTFVANRVSEIQELTSSCKWHHVTSSSNPADMVSRGVLPQDLICNDLWWHGPRWLSDSSSHWPREVTALSTTGEIPEARSTITSLLAVSVSDDILKISSSLLRVQRVVAYCKRFIINCNQPKQSRNLGPLTVKELKHSLNICIKLAQRVSYQQECIALENGQPLPRKSTLLELHPFIDKFGLVRVGGRLQNSSLPFETRHQIILPPRHHFTRLIIEHEHERLLHAGPQLLINSLRSTYWVPSARRVVRSILHRCLRCFRLTAKTQTQLMGNLPSLRVQPARAFLNTGVDYAGPVYIRSSSRRSKIRIKSYIAVFVCLATRAIHLELVTELTSEAFLAALRRFMSRRGKCANIYSDNGTNFIGASKELRKLVDMLKRESESISDVLAIESCQWHFIPPNSPHFGGLWESAVKSMKYHLRRTAGNSSLTFEEMSTLLTQIEACLNSRPLCKLSDDPSDLSYLTPGHFLIGEPLTNLPDPDLSDLAVNRLNRWQRIQQMTQQLWRRWSTDYLTSLQQRSKWASPTQNLRRGMVVLIKDDHLPPLKWRLAAIEDVHPGPDGYVRVVSVRTDQGSLIKRPTVKICPLPPPDIID